MNVQFRLVFISESKARMAQRRNRDSRIAIFGLLLKLGGSLIYCFCLDFFIHDIFFCLYQALYNVNINK